MNRKKFISSSALALVGTGLPSAKVIASKNEFQKIMIPPYLKTGDMIGITSPAGYILREDIIPSATLMQQWGFKIRVGYTIGKRDFTYGGTDEERLNDFQMMLDDPQIKAI
ncbi:MAG TPA: LD-carboxypeptidase, partial [Niabella sp.]|nr:LD-carboxypeptidase [Niabella sp.]